MSETLPGGYPWERFERAVILSPHLDDAVLSCGALLAALDRRVFRLVVTVCAGDPATSPAGGAPRSGRPPFAAPAERRREDRAAMRALGCDFIHLGFPDAIDRRDPASGRLLYRGRRGYLSPPANEDRGHVEALHSELRRVLGDLGETLLLGPLAIGHHVDHVICARAALDLAGERSLLLYEDFPYPVTAGEDEAEDAHVALERLGRSPGRRFSVPFELEDKLELIRHYRSQIPLLFGDEAGLRRALELAPHETFWSVKV